MPKLDIVIIKEMSQRKVYNFSCMSIVIEKEPTVEKIQIQPESEVVYGNLQPERRKSLIPCNTSKIIPVREEKTNFLDKKNSEDNFIIQNIKADRFWAQKEMEKFLAKQKKSKKSTCSCTIF